MEHLTVNRVGKPRRGILNGREHIIVPMTMIVQGVLNGSQGPLYYDEKEFGRNPSDWNGIPILLGHPQGSGRSPDIINKYGVGYVFKSRVRNSKLQAEAWFDIIKLQELAPQAYSTINNGGKIELSTGFNSAFNRTPGMYQGKTYNASVTGIRPDHLAVFVDGSVGACSCNDGCGINNKKSNNKESKMTKIADKKAGKVANGGATPPSDARGELIESLVTNCGCNAEELNALDDNALAVIQHVHDFKIANSGDPEDDDDVEDGVANGEGCMEDEEEEGKPGKVVKPKTPVVNRKSATESLSIDEWLVKNNAPEELQDYIRGQQLRMQQEKAELVVNIRKTDRLTLSEKQLMALPMEDKLVGNQLMLGLRSISELVAPKQTEVRVANYRGAAVTNRSRQAKPQVALGLPELDFSQQN